MKLVLQINKVTKKKKWDKVNCDTCIHRFSCFSGNEVVLEADAFEEVAVSPSNLRVQCIAKFLIPDCIRVGLFKQLGDNGQFSNFKHGRIEAYMFYPFSITVSLSPPVVTIFGTRYNKRK